MESEIHLGFLSLNLSQRVIFGTFSIIDDIRIVTRTLDHKVQFNKTSDMQPIILQGRPSFSDFRLSFLQSALRASAPKLDISKINAVDVFFIEAKKPLVGKAKQRTFAPT